MLEVANLVMLLLVDSSLPKFVFKRAFTTNNRKSDIAYINEFIYINFFVRISFHKNAEDENRQQNIFDTRGKILNYIL